MANPKHLLLVLNLLLALQVSAQRPGPLETLRGAMTRQEAGLKGAVRTVHLSLSQGTVWTVSFDERGRKIEEYYWSFPAEIFKEKGKTVFNYDAGGKIKESLIYDEKGAVVNKVLYTYDEQQRLLRISHPFFIPLDTYREVVSQTDFIYTGKNLSQTVRVLLLKGSDDPLDKYISVYDAQGKALGISHELRGKADYARVLKYDAAGRLESMDEINIDKTKSLREIYSYNEHGDLKEKRMYTGTPSALSRTETYIYEYDAAGNWTRQITSSESYRLDNDTGQVLSHKETDSTTSRILIYYQ